MKRYDEVDIQKIFDEDWCEGYIYIAPYRNKHIVVNENSEQLLYVKTCRLTFKPIKGETIMVQHYKENPWEYRTFLMFHNGKYICEDPKNPGVYYSWQFGKED